MTFDTVTRSTAEVTFWEAVSTSSWGRYIYAIERDVILRAHRLAGHPTRALEIGCEGGRWSKLLAERGWKMVCTDVDPRALAVCHQRVPDAACLLVDPSASVLPCVAVSVRLILCIEVAQALNAPWFPREVARTLQPGGVFAGVLFNRASYRGIVAHATAAARGSVDYYQRTYAGLRRELASHGVDVIHERGFCWFPVRRASNSRFVDAFAAAERGLRLREMPRISPWVVFIARKKQAGAGFKEPVR